MGLNGHMEYYELPDLKEIIERTSEIFDMTITPEAALELARRAVGRLVLLTAYLSA